VEPRGTPRRDAYDAIVIGSGLGGLSAAAFLAMNGHKPLVVERLDRAGGYAASFRRGDYTIDPAVHMVGLGERLLLMKVLRYLGIADLCTFTATGSFYEAHFPDATVRAPVGTDAYVAAHTAALGRDEEAGIRRYLELCARLHDEVHQLPPALSLKELEEAVQRFPTLFKYRNATLAEIFDECLQDDRTKAACGAFWPLLGLPPEQLSFFTMTTPIVTLTREGPFQVDGSTQALVDAFVTAVERHGGELLFGQEVVKVMVEDGHAAGVVLADGSEVRAPIVVSNADARRTFRDLVGPDHLPAPFLKRIGRMRPSLSAAVIFAATDLDVHALDLAHTTFIYEDWSHAEAYRRAAAGRPGGTWLTVPTRNDPTLAPAGEHLLVFTCPAPAGALRSRDERVLPDLRRHLRFVEVAGPETLARYAGNEDGAIYGWENSPQHAGSRRLHHWTPLPGLFMCGHWTQPGSGAFRVIFSGVETTMAVLGAGYADEFLRGLDLGG
jgi:prolycopene isomerase